MRRSPIMALSPHGAALSRCERGRTARSPHIERRRLLGGPRPIATAGLCCISPEGFDLRRPALMVVFLHGHGATLQRDVIDRQRVPEQVSEAGVNSVLVAPQLASDARIQALASLGAGGFGASCRGERRTR